MKSPFAIFRKHQKVLMVVLTGLAMFAFVVLDSLTQNMAAFPPILGFLVVAGVAWAIVRNWDYSWAYVVIAGFAGAILGGQLQDSLAVSDATVTASFGSFSEEELRNTLQRQELCNQFLRRAFEQAHEGDESPPYQVLSSNRFGFGALTSQAAMLHLVLLQEAEQLGVSVSDAEVTALIDTVTSNKLSGRAFSEIVMNLRVSGKELYELLAEQMVARQTLMLISPQYVSSPEDYWDAYKKVNLKQELAVVPIAVDQFLDLTPQGSDDELQAFFAAHKDVFPGEKGPGEPGFRQPGRMKIGYLEIDFEAIEKSIPEITDEEIAEYYEANKEEQFRNNAPLDFPAPMTPQAPAGDADPAAPGTPAAPGDGPKLMQPKTNPPTDPEKETPPSEPTDPAAPPAPKSGAPAPAEPQQPGTPAEPAKPAAETPPAEPAKTAPPLPHSRHAAGGAGRRSAIPTIRIDRQRVRQHS